MGARRRVRSPSGIENRTKWRSCPLVAGVLVRSGPRVNGSSPLEGSGSSRWLSCFQGLALQASSHPKPHTREALARLVADKGDLHEARYLDGPPIHGTPRWSRSTSRRRMLDLPPHMPTVVAMRTIRADVRRAGFYVSGEIRPEVPAVLKRIDTLELTDHVLNGLAGSADEHDQRLSAAMRGIMASKPSWYPRAVRRKYSC